MPSHRITDLVTEPAKRPVARESAQVQGSGSVTVTFPFGEEGGKGHELSGSQNLDAYECSDCGGEKGPRAAHCRICAPKYRRTLPERDKRQTTLYLLTTDLDKLGAMARRLQTSQSEVVGTLIRIAHRDFERKEASQ